MSCRFSLSLISLLTACCAHAFTVDRIDPPNWWSGMKNSSLQLQIHGKDVRDAEVSIDYPGVGIDSVARLDGSPNWLYVYLNISPEAKPGEIKIKMSEGKERKTVKYPLIARNSQRRGAQGFDSSDVLYLLMPDRFANGDRANDGSKSLRFNVAADRNEPNQRHGGDLKGILDNVGYIDSLGVTAVWLTPVLENDMPGGSYHGYATTDYYRIDPRFGTNELYAAMIDTLHGREIKTVMDMIFNHCGSEHPWRLDPPASDWFNFQDNFTQTNYRLSTLTDPYSSEYDRKLTTDGWFVDQMPDMNQRNPHLMNYLIQNSIWWIETSGVDGIRMDTYPYADYKAMNRWIKSVENEYPDFKIVGECWFTDPGAEAVWQRNNKQPNPLSIRSELPIVMDFGLMLKGGDMKPFRERTDSWNGLNALYDHLGLDFLYPDANNVLRFFDNHDTERAIASSLDSLDRWKQAYTFLLTIPGIPQVYYGAEQLMSGTREGGDGNVRKDMPGGFSDSGSDSIVAGVDPRSAEAIAFFSKVANWRKGSKAISKGSMKHFLPDNGIYLYERAVPGEQVIVVLNGRDEPLTSPLAKYSEVITEEATYTDVVSGKRYTLSPGGSITLAPRESLILQRTF